MDAKTERALRASVRKWKKIAAGDMGSDGAENCPLCKLFLDNDCRGCPVFQLTRKQWCESTPYDVWQVLPASDTTTADDGERVNTEVSRRVAEAEHSFLKALLP